MSKVQLAVGQVWKDREGREVTITRKDDHDKYPFYGSNDETYTPDGTEYENFTTAKDLIELVQDENGWRPWKATANSQCPVAGETLVHLRFSNGNATSLKHLSPAGDFAWRDVGPESIVAYKIVEEASKASEPVHAEANSTSRRHSHYFKDASQIDEIDVYRVCDLFEVDDPSGATQHAIKKLLCAGKRGAKDRGKDYREAIDTLNRRLAMWEGE